ncbi:MAG TPA: hypothetical protein VF422_05060 [Dokdonella sp.]
METTETKPLSERLKDAAAAMREGNFESQLDPGIADVVIMLRNLGFHPTDSGDGVSKPDDARVFDVKHVICSFDAEKFGDMPAIAEQQFIGEAKRLQHVLGSGWKVEASFDVRENSYILLATKDEPPSPRHAAALAAWPFEARAQLNRGTLSERLFEAGCALHKALQHELGRR